MKVENQCEPNERLNQNGVACSKESNVHAQVVATSLIYL